MITKTLSVCHIFKFDKREAGDFCINQAESDQSSECSVHKIVDVDRDDGTQF